METAQIRSRCADITYQLIKSKPSRFRGLDVLSVEQLPERVPARLLMLPSESLTIADQIIEEATRLMEIEDERIVCPIDIVDVNNSLGFIFPADSAVTIGQVFQRYEHAFAESISVMICAATLELMSKIHQHNCCLHGIHADNVQLLGRKRVRIGPMLPPSCAIFLKKPHHLFNPSNKPAHEFTALDDLYGVAVLLLCFLQSNLWSFGDKHHTTMQFIKDEGLLPYIDALTEVSDDSIEFLRQALSNKEAQRYRDAKTMREDLKRSLAGLSLRISKAPIQEDAGRSNLYNTRDINAHIEKRENTHQRTETRVDRKRLKFLAKLVVLSESGLTAHINLAPGTCFPRTLLVKLLQTAGVVHGIDESAVAEATRSMPSIRRIVLARGTPPYPGKAGLSVRGVKISALQKSISIDVSPDGMRAIAHARPKQAISHEDIQKSLQAADVNFGIIPSAVQQLQQQGCGIEGEILIAQGRLATPGISAHYLIAEGFERADKRTVKRNHVVASWRKASPALNGQRVDGSTITASIAADKQPSDLAGEGVEIHREQQDIILRATSDGVIQQQPDGTISVLPIREIYNGVRAGEEQVCEDVLVIYGDVADGAILRADSGIRIEGELGDAEVHCGGDMEVLGDINGGKQKIHAAGVVKAENIKSAHVVAYAISVTSHIQHSDIVSLSDVRAYHIANSSITAANDITCHDAGSEEGELCTLWAGHHIPLAIQLDIAVLQEKRLCSERTRMIKERNTLAGDAERMKQKAYRFNVGGFINSEHLQLLHDRIAQLKNRDEHLHQSLEDARHIIVEHKEQADELKSTADNDRAIIKAEHVFAHVDMKVAESATRHFTNEQEQVIHKLS